MLKKITTIIILAMSLSACGSWISVNRLDVQQGNVLTAKQLKQVHRGMTKQQVIRVLGNPVLTDVFHPDQLVLIDLYHN